MTISSRFDDRPFTAAMAREAGITRNCLPHKLVASGEVRKVLSDVYVATCVKDSLDLRASAAALVMPDHAVVVDRSAAWLHDVDDPGLRGAGSGPGAGRSL